MQGLTIVTDQAVYIQGNYNSTKKIPAAFLAGQSSGAYNGGMQYKAPGRAWKYDTDFNDASLLPPLTPRFVYLKQELFVRKFEL